MVALSCLIAQRASRETIWHIRGSLRNGLSGDEVESIQTAIEMVATECGVDVRSGMPRVQDVLPEELEYHVK
jgi:alkylhydroperoxidase/carboxymuconolactone decarboxylase family protein YurZ